MNTGFWEISCLDETDVGDALCSLRGPTGVNTWAFFIFAFFGVPPQISTWSKRSWQDVQCGHYKQASYECVLEKKDLQNTIPTERSYIGTWGGTSALSGPYCVEAPGCHLTICGGVRCIGKGLVNAYSLMVRLQTPVFFLPCLNKGRVNGPRRIVFVDMVDKWSVHRFSLPTVVFPSSRALSWILLFNTLSFRSPAISIHFPSP